MALDGKTLKSVCNSCGKTTIHDSTHKAGKSLVNFLKMGGGQKTDIEKKPGANEVLEDITTQASTKLDDSDQEELSDEETEASHKSRRVRK